MRARVVLVTLVAVVAGGAWWVLRSDPTRLEEALSTLPDGTQRVAFTDWAFARSSVAEEDIEAFANAAYDADLTRTSAVENVAVAIEDNYGISVRELDWEVYGQSSDGAADVLKGEFSFEDLRSTLRSLGYDEPEADDGAWAGDEDLVASIDPELTPAQQNVVLLENDGLVVFSDDAGYAEKVTGGFTSRLTSKAGDPVSAILWTGDQACSSLAMSEADESDQAVADDLVEKAGGVSPLDGLLMARAGSGRVTVVMGFESDDQAEENLQPRTDLASGDAPGLGGSFRDRFSVASAEAHGDLVVLDRVPAADEDALFSEIDNGPVLFATC